MRPQYLDLADATVAEDAAWLCELCRDGLERRATRGELQARIASEAQVRPDHKQLKGLAKILLDGAGFDTTASISPKELRERVFKRATVRGPLAMGPNPFGRPTATDVLIEIGAELDLSAEEVHEGLYADLKQEQRISKLRELTAADLVQRYNVGLIQALLLRATSLTATLDDPSAARVRQLMRYIKFHQLMHRAQRVQESLVITIDGPESVLKQSTRYGLKLATFFPALLLNERWTLHADLIWKNKKRALDLDHEVGLVSHYDDRGGYTPRVAIRFAERFAEIDTKWKLTEGEEPLDLGGQVVMPDFTLKKGRKKVHLEILGYWRRDYLQRRIEGLSKRGSKNLILAVSKRLMADAAGLEGFPGMVIPFAEIVPVKKVLAAADAC